MIYSIVFISNQQLRDIKLEGILNPDFTMDGYIHEGSFDYTLTKRTTRGRSYYDIWGSKFKGAILKSTKWKTAKGAQTVLNGLKNITPEDRKKYST